MVKTVLSPSRRRPEVDPGLVGTARLDPRAQQVHRRLRPGDVAVVDLVDLDAETAARIAARRPAAVLNAAASTSGRYPNRGPEVLLEAGILLVDRLGPDVLTVVRNGRPVLVAEGHVLLPGRRGTWLEADPPLVGVEQTPLSVALAAEHARAGMAAQLDAFAASTALVLSAERDLLLEGAGVPDLATAMRDRPVLVVAQGYGYASDLRRLRPFVAERRPVVIAVDGGADALLELGTCPDIVVTDGEAVGDDALCCGAEVVAHLGRDGWAPVLERLENLQVPAVYMESGLTTEDTAILLAHAHGASSIVTVGSHATLEEFLDRGRAGMASSFLTRLRAGVAVVDATTVATLHQPRMSWGMVALLLVAGAVALLAALSATPWGQDQLGALSEVLARWEPLTDPLGRGSPP